MICPQCGSETRPGAAFCRQCGARLDNVQTNVPQAGTQMSYQQPSPAYYPPPVQSSGAAITSLIVGIITHVLALVVACPTIAVTYGIGVIICTPVLLAGWATSLITGYIGRQQIRASQGKLTGDGAAVAGIILGWIGVGLTVILVVTFIILFILMMVFGLFMSLPFES
ncbi:MAG: zinc-ribbon domain-containing protein [Anaerolineae bacterium]|jgi:hypothetical protein